MVQELPAANQHIRKALDTIGSKWTPSVAAWLSEMNPMAMRQLDALQAKIDEAVDDTTMKRCCAAWRDTWLFWIRSKR